MLVKEFKVGDDLAWLKGDCHMIAKVIEVEKDRVKLSGITKDYWMKKNTLICNVNKLYPGMNSSYAPN